MTATHAQEAEEAEEAALANPPVVARDARITAGFAEGGTLTLLLGDVESSTRLWHADRERAARVLGSLHDLVRASVERHRGVLPVEQGEGDSFVAAFSRASDALACALDLQRALERDRGLGIRVRMGLHTGEVDVAADGRYGGEAFSRCARMRDLAAGGQILLSRPTHDLVADRLVDGVTLVDLGSHRLKDIGRPEQIYQVCHPDLPAVLASLETAERRHNLPSELTTFVGREEELADLSALALQHRIVTLVGAGGCGKTRLALALGARLVPEFPDGVWWVDFGPMGDPDLVASALASALGVREVPNEPVASTLQRHLKARSILLVLDNCEHLVSSCAALVPELARACPGLHVLATSREPLGVEGELGFRVPSLSFADPGESLPVETLERFESIRLFVERAREARPHFRLTPDNGADVARICARVDGIPLAVELAAGRVRVLSPRQIADGLHDSFRLLAGGGRALPRQRTLEASIEWSFRHLNPEERLLLARLSVFAGGFSLVSAEAVAAGDPLEEYAVLDVLSRLVDKSLVQADSRGTDTRYRLLETIRVYARRELVAAGEADLVGSRHLAHFVGVVEELAPELEGAGLNAALERLRVELDNVRAAMDWSIVAGDARGALRLADAMRHFWITRGHLTEARRRTRAALDLAGAEPAHRLGALVAEADVLMMLGDVRASAARAEEAVATAREIGDRGRLGDALDQLGWAMTYTDPHAARVVFDEAVACTRASGDLFDLNGALTGLANLDINAGALPSARRHAAEAVEVARAQGSAIGLFTALFFLGWVDSAAGRYADAEEALGECADRARALENPFWVAMALVQLGEVAVMRGDLASAETLLTDSLAVTDEAGSVWPVVLGQWHRARLTLVNGELASAAAQLEEVATLAADVGGGWLAALATAAGGDIAALTGDRDDAVARWERAWELAVAYGNPLAIARVRLRLAFAAADDDLRRAEDLVHEALTAFVEMDDRAGIVDALELLAAFAVERDGIDDAARLLGAADAMREAMGYARPPDGTAPRRPAAEAFWRRLERGDESARWEEGRTLGQDEVVAYARKRRGTRRRPSSGWASLTPAERQVADLVAKGLTNPEIASQLFVTRGTVKAHLAHIFDKLGISHRAELAAEVTRRE